MIKVTVSNSSLSVVSPYHPSFPSKAKDLGGKWNPDRRAWIFDARDESRVRDLCRKIYGTDGTTPTCDLVTIRLTALVDRKIERGGVFAAGRCIASATGRDSGARLCERVVLLSGCITSGGSMKNWLTHVYKGAVVELKDVPRAAIEKINTEKWSVEIVEQAVNKAALRAELETLKNRVAEIEKQLAE